MGRRACPQHRKQALGNSHTGKKEEIWQYSEKAKKKKKKEKKTRINLVLFYNVGPNTRMEREQGGDSVRFNDSSHLSWEESERKVDRVP